MSALAAKHRLVEALEAYVEAVAGDGALESRGRGSRSGGRADGELVNAALELHERLAERADESEPSPGARASRRARQGGGFDAVAGRARDMISGR